MKMHHIAAANLGFPRIGPRRELKFELEKFRAGESSAVQVEAAAREVRRGRWQLQSDAGVTRIPSNDFSLYDHVLDTAVMIGAIPSRYTGPQYSDIEEMEARIRRALGVFRIEQFWVNPDYGLKTCRWEEVRRALRNMVIAAQRVKKPCHGSAAPIQDGASLAGNDSIEASSTRSGETGSAGSTGFDAFACRPRLRLMK